MHLNPSTVIGTKSREVLACRWAVWLSVWFLCWGMGVRSLEAGIEPGHAEKAKTEAVSQQHSNKQVSASVSGATNTPSNAHESDAAEAHGSRFQWQAFLGPFHTLILHYPIGFLSLVFILELYRLRKPSAELGRITSLVIGLSFFSGAVAATLGVMRANNGGYEPKTLDVHRWCGIAVPFFTLVTWWLHSKWMASARNGGFMWGYRVVLGVNLMLLGVAGHFGGNLTHGSNYLTENAPPFLKALLEPKTTIAVTSASGTDTVKKEDARAIYFREKVQPIFEQKCYRCHGEEKQKGGFRLDQPVAAVKGGESGKPAIQPNDPMNSEVVRVIMLPRSDDAAMPPEGKEPVTPEEILNIVRWIQEGAVFPK